jgi:uncharacterized lipoprotein YehR (DUF1307 family)
MKKIISIVLAAIVCCSVISCNEKPKSYKFVTLGKDGKEQVEEFSAKNDVEALKMYFDRMEKIVVENIGKEPTYEAMYVVSPEGDTLNTDEKLLQSIMKDIPVLKDPPLPAGEKPVEEPQPAPSK